MSVLVETSVRTQVRAAFVAALAQLNAPDAAARLAPVEIVTDYLTETEIKQSPSYGVIVTDEEAEEPARRTHGSMGTSDLALTVLVIIYVRDETDRRAVLDAAIEDVTDALRRGQAVQAVAPFLRYEGLQADEGTTAAKPYAQAKLRWTVRGVRRSVSW